MNIALQTTPDLDKTIKPFAMQRLHLVIDYLESEADCSELESAAKQPLQEAEESELDSHLCSLPSESHMKSVDVISHRIHEQENKKLSWTFLDWSTSNWGDWLWILFFRDTVHAF